MGMTFGYSQMLRVGSLFQSIASELGAAVETMSAYIYNIYNIYNIYILTIVIGVVSQMIEVITMVFSPLTTPTAPQKRIDFQLEVATGSRTSSRTSPA